MKGIYNTKNLVLALSLCFAASAQSQVGIGTDDPHAMLDVNGTATIGNTLTSNGKLMLKSLDPAPTDGVAQLTRRNDTGEVSAVRSSTGNTKPFNYIKYTIKCSNAYTDWIRKFDTKIPVNDYTVFIVGSQFSTTNPDNAGLIMSPGTTSTSNGTFGPMGVTAYKEVGTTKYTTWQLSADFATASPVGGAGTWEIHCIIINNELIQQLAPATVTLSSGGSGAPPAGNGAAQSMPAGL